ncbi:MAG TPA: hypothetical protein VN837_04260 [Chloroflexota bacterium]|nr:hypothetical protein [Chloroflexota bacterium]
MGHLSLSDSVLIQQEIAPANLAANTNGTTIDMQGWDGVLFEFNIGVMAAGVTFDAYVQNSANANFSGPANIVNAALTQVANTANATLQILDVYRPTNRYVRLSTIPGAGVFAGVTSTRYRRTGILPPTQPATTNQIVKVQVN